MDGYRMISVRMLMITRIDTHNVIQILLGAHVSRGIDKETV